MGRKKKKKPLVIRPWTFSPCPTPDEVRLAWMERKHSSAAFVRLLSVLAELTTYTDCSLEHLGGFGNIAGRKGGLKAYLEEKLPELTPKYKSMSRYVRLSYRLRETFSIYPPAALSLMHPDLPLPKRNIPFLTNHCRKVYREHFADLLPTYVAYNAAIEKRCKDHHPKYHWGPPLPQNQWRDAENTWRRKYIAPVALKAIKAEHSFYARDYIPLPPRGRDDGSYELSIHGRGFLSDDWIAGYDY